MITALILRKFGRFSERTLKLAPFTVITGPRRRLAQGGPGVFAAPFGDMMLSGCFGLVAAFLELENYPVNLADY